MVVLEAVDEVVEETDIFAGCVKSPVRVCFIEDLCDAAGKSLHRIVPREKGKAGREVLQNYQYRVMYYWQYRGGACLP